MPLVKDIVMYFDVVTLCNLCTLYIHRLIEAYWVKVFAASLLVMF